METLKKYAPIILAAIILGGLALALTDNSLKRSYLESLTKPILKERDSLLRANAGLLERLRSDTTLVRFKRERDSLQALRTVLGDSIKELTETLKRNEKIIIDYGGTFDDRLDMFTNNVTRKD